MTNIEFDIDRAAVKHYFLTALSLSCCGMVFFCSFFVAMIAPVAYFIFFVGVAIGSFTFCQWLCPQQANNLRYRLEGSTLRADGGVFFLFRKSIPLERVTDVNLVQGPLLRFFGIWAIRIQTAGSTSCEATLYGVREPEKVRTLILLQRQSTHREKTGDI